MSVIVSQVELTAAACMTAEAYLAYNMGDIDAQEYVMTLYTWAVLQGLNDQPWSEELYLELLERAQTVIDAYLQDQS